ncbi:hypothetical protein HBI62_155080 [Parastagonospora nodorum]|nr:hypothetical protein HBH84_092180 [Parastagonospora nodorum]KAH5218349.1 hypothetical protein HBI62_155080 [Parastagonospora nodorum]KAH5363631.1 hypothetical protein HBI48_083940 [Parastagonospora nodorum]
MNPALLLDPRGARKRGDADRVNNNNNNVAPTPQFSPTALLNPRSLASKRPASSGSDLDRGRSDPTIAGQISLVERLHNVQERTASPAKRIKTDEDRKKSTHRQGFNGGSSLELQKTSSQAPSQTGPSIDLTMSDDDDVQLVGDNMEELICVGKVKHTYVQAHTVPYPDPKKYLGNSGQQGRIKVSFRRAGNNRNNLNIMVTDPTGREFGRVDMKSSTGLCPLIDGAKANGLIWMAWTDIRRKQAGEGPPGSPFSGLISMTLQLYCKRKWAHDIGKFHKGKNIQLLRPVFELQRYDYYNPQDGDSLTRIQAIDPSFQTDQFTQQGPTPGAPGSNYVLRSVDEIRADVADVFDTVVSKSDEVPTREPSSHIKTELYPHQKQALYFMWDKEQDHSAEEHDQRKDTLWAPKLRDNGRKFYRHVITGEELDVKPQACRGGILADEMGLGKTLSILSLVADDDSIKAANDFATKKPPPVPPQSKMIQPLVNSKATLLVCPLSTMTNWKEQMKEHFPAGSGLKWTRYHGSERFNMSSKDLAKYDIVVTTYHIIQKDINDRKRPLPYINWFRIVLDEAHTIRNPTAQSRATCVLFGQRRWAVTGTPVQNRLEDLGALFNFIKLSPFNTQQGFNQYVVHPFKNADPDVVPKLQLLVSTVTMRRTKEIIKDEVPKRNDIIVKLEFSKEERQLHDWFEKDTQRKVNIATSGDKMGGNTYARILTAILNMRLICAHGRDLLSDDALKTTDGMTYDNPMEIGEDEGEAPALTRSQAYDMLDLLNQTDNDECVFCGQGPGTKHSILAVDSDDEDEDGDVSDTIGFMTTCYHIVCPKHLKKLKQQWAETLMADGRIQCQICEDRNNPTTFELKRSDFRNFQDERERIRGDPKLAKKIGSYNGPHTKTRALLNDLEEHRAWSIAHPTERPIKSVVFSCWTTHLDLIELALKDHQHRYCRLDGRMSRQNRDESMRVFREDPTIIVMLVSIGAGGLGLNLTTANKVFMMEPQFNPAAEAQAVDRVHRLGQDREVMIKRFIMDNSFEEKMVELQQKKKKLADLTLARQRLSKEEQTKQRLEELRSLFR